MTFLPIPSDSGNKVYIGPRPDMKTKISLKVIPNEAQKLAAYLSVDAAKFDALKIKTAIVFLSDEEKAKNPIDPFYTARKIDQINFPIPEGGVPPSTEKVKELVEQMLKVLEKGNVYMHCGSGTGRTGFMVACGIVLRQKLSAQDARNATGQLIPGFNLTLLQRAFLAQLSESCGNKEDFKAAPIKKIPAVIPPKEAPALSSLSSLSKTDPDDGFIVISNEPPSSSGPSASSSAGPMVEADSSDQNEFEKYAMPFTSNAGFKLYAGPSPKWLTGPNNLEKTFKTVAVLLSDAEKTKYKIQEYYNSKNIQQIYLPIPDMGEPASLGALDAFIEAVFTALEQGNVYLHCGQGKGRTGLVFACMAVRKMKMASLDAILFTHKCIHGSLTSSSQKKYVEQYYNNHVKQPSGS